MEETLLTPEEVAEFLRVETKTIKAWLRSRKLGGVLLAGSLWRIRQSDLQEFLTRWESKPSASAMTVPEVGGVEGEAVTPEKEETEADSEHTASAAGPENGLEP